MRNLFSPRKTFVSGLLGGIFLVLVLGGLLSFLLSPLLLTHRTPFPGEEEIGDSRVRAAIPDSDKQKKNPLSSSNEVLLAGKQIYTGNCAFCHGVSGKGEAAIGRNMFPPAVDLTSDRTKSKTDGEIHWILDNGISFVGMPAWRGTLTDEQMWQVTSYIRALQNGTVVQPAQAALASPTPAGAKPAAGSPNLTPIPPTTNANGGGSSTAPAGTTAAYSSTNASGTTAAAGTAQVPGDPQKGSAIFIRAGCTACHGEKAQGDFGPKIAETKLPFDAFKAQVRKPAGKSMPPFSVTDITDDELVDLYAFLQSLK